MRSNVASLLLRFEEGELDNDEIIELFQMLIDDGLAWKLQGSYGRIARDLILAGECSAPANVKRALRM